MDTSYHLSLSSKIKCQSISKSQARYCQLRLCLLNKQGQCNVYLFLGLPILFLVTLALINFSTCAENESLPKANPLFVLSRISFGSSLPT